MKVRNSLKSLRGRHRDNRIVRRKGRVYVINKTHRRFKAARAEWGAPAILPGAASEKPSTLSIAHLPHCSHACEHISALPRHVR